MQVHQLLMGRDLALDRSNPVHSMAAQMLNFCYLVEFSPGKALAVDAAWDVEGVLRFAEDKGLEITCAAFTHRHLDHTGGRVKLGGRKVVVPGVAELAQRQIAIKVGKQDLDAVIQQTGCADCQVVSEGDEVVQGVTCLESPGHTPGSICFLLGDAEALITGDTLFIGSCGRVDLQESNPGHMLTSLSRLAKLPETCRVLPGHHYGVMPESTIGYERKMNMYVQNALNRDTLEHNLTSNGMFAGPVTTSSLPDYLEAARRSLAETTTLCLMSD